MNNMYPRVKVRVETDEENQYAYEKSSLQSLKGFQWLSLDDSSSTDEAPRSPVRIPGSCVPKSKDNSKKTILEENRVNVPPPRAVLSSPDNDGIDISKTKTRRELLSGLKNHNLCQNRHAKCKVIPIYAASFTSSLVNIKEAVERKTITGQKVSSTCRSLGIIDREQVVWTNLVLDLIDIGLAK